MKIKTFGKDSFSLDKENVDLRYLEQLVDGEQTQALAWLLRYAKEKLAGGSPDVGGVARELERILERDGLSGICGRDVPAGLAMPRIQEIFACLNRW